jgi:hypothetical protein
MLALAFAAAAGALGGPFSIVVPVVFRGILWLASAPPWLTDGEADERHQLRALQIQLGAIELLSVWGAVAFAGWWIAPGGHYLLGGAIVGAIAAAATVALIAATRAVNNVLVALVPTAAVASAAAAVVSRLVL